MGILLDKKEIADIIKYSLGKEAEELKEYEWIVTDTDEAIAKSQAVKALDEIQKLIKQVPVEGETSIFRYEVDMLKLWEIRESLK